jgi:hypothetical protein
MCVNYISIKLFKKNQSQKAQHGMTTVLIKVGSGNLSPLMRSWTGSHLGSAPKTWSELPRPFGQCTYNCSSNGQGMSLTMQCPWDQANQEPSGEKATLQVSQLDFQSNWWGRPGLSSASSSGSSGQETECFKNTSSLSDHQLQGSCVPIALGNTLVSGGSCHLNDLGQNSSHRLLSMEVIQPQASPLLTRTQGNLCEGGPGEWRPHFLTSAWAESGQPGLCEVPSRTPTLAHTRKDRNLLVGRLPRISRTLPSTCPARCLALASLHTWTYWPGFLHLPLPASHLRSILA